MLDMTPEARAAHVLATLGEALENGDLDRALGQFQHVCYWRDLVAFTWNIRTMEGGIALGARLRQLGVPAIIVEKNARPGDSWRKRYKSLCLHDPIWYDHLPYLPFPPNWPVFSPKDKIGDWLEMYTRIMELNYWGSTTRSSRRCSSRRG